MIRTLLVIALVAFAVPAHADVTSKAAAEAAYAEGQRYYAQGDYLGAAQRFVSAHALDADPAYLFNAAQAYRFAKSCELAAGYYRQFLAAAPAAPNRAKVEAYAVEMEACTPKRAAGPEPKPDPVNDGLIHKEPTPEQPAPTPARGRMQRILGIAVGVAGVVAIGIGGYYTHEVGTLSNDTSALHDSRLGMDWRPQDEDRENQLIADGGAAEIRARISLGIGGALLAGGILLYVLAPDREQPQLAITPTSDGAMAFGTFRF